LEATPTPNEFASTPSLGALADTFRISRDARGKPLAPQALEEISATPASGVWNWVLLAVIVCAIPLIVYLTVQNSLLHPLVREAELHEWQRLILRPSILWALMGAVLLAFRSVLWFFYRPFSSASMADAPLLTVVIPAYNEGAMVQQAIESAACARYPKERLEIIAVDDGSTDDTWKYIQEAAERHGEVVKALRHPRNLGKRAALALGFEQARGDVVVTLDSDSALDRNALLAIAGPFRDPKVGAVAGKVQVYNRREGIIPRMLHVRFTVSFDLLRGSESAYGNVFCCPGALTALRTSVVRQLLKPWLEQKFLGAKCTIGEDRAMTNLVLQAGYNTVYQGSAVVHTVVPTTYLRLCKMLLRWDRSYVREELRFLRVVGKRPLATRVIALTDRIITDLRFPVYYFSLILLISLIAMHPWMLVRLFLAVGLFSTFNMIYYLRSERSVDMVYGVIFSYFELLTMFWIFPYALCTVRARSWLTR
jgi:hyaluronan synthase